MHAACSQWLIAQEGGVHTLLALIALQGVPCAVHALPHAAAGAGGHHDSGMLLPHSCAMSCAAALYTLLHER
jgi:hypothetical protein